MNETKQVDIERFGEFMRRCRGSRTKKEIARLLDVSYVYVGMLEKGERHPPPKRLRQICDLFKEPYQKWKRTIDWELERDDLIRRIKAYDVLYNWYGVQEPLRFQNRDGLEVTVSSPEAGRLEYLPEATIEERPARSMIHRIPVLSLAQCGQWTEYTDSDFPPGVADAYVHGDTKDANAFFLRAEGRSMTKAGIDPGDLLLIEPSRASRIHNGSIVLAITDRGQTVKRFYDAGDLIVLQPDGLEGEPLTVDKKPKDPPDRIYPVTEIRKVLQ